MVRDFLLKNIDSICPEETPLFLHYHNSFELLIMVILSAQTTDAQVNKVAPALFKAYPTPERMADAPLMALESLIYTTGFYHAKSKYIKKHRPRFKDTLWGGSSHNHERAFNS